MDCEGYETAIEKERHGALEAEGAERLAGHLESCARCRSFRDFVHDTEETMTTHATTTLNRIDWEKLALSAATWRRQLHTSMWRSALGGALGAVPMWVLISDEVGRAGAFVGALVILVATLMYFRQETQRLRADLVEADTSPHELLAVYRAQLDRRVRASRQDVWASLPLALLPLGMFAMGPETLPRVLAAVSMAVFFLGMGVYTRLVRLPRLRRERAELD